MSMSRHYVSEKMLPRIASAQLYVDVVHNEDLPAAPPTAGRMAAVAQSFLPAIVSNKAFSSHDALTHIDSLLPMINSGIKESKSVVAQEIINRISINNKLLYFEMTAIRIQSAARKFLANLRVQRMKRRVELFVNITESCAARYVEEIVLATSFEICLEFYRQHNRFKMLQESVEKELSVVADELLRGLIDQMTVEVTNETISDVIDVVMTLRYCTNTTSCTVHMHVQMCSLFLPFTCVERAHCCCPRILFHVISLPSIYACTMATQRQDASGAGSRIECTTEPGALSSCGG